MDRNSHNERFYRDMISKPGMKRFTVSVEETDLLIISDKNIRREITEEVLSLRVEIKDYIRSNPDFYYSFSPVECRSDTEIIKLMCSTAWLTGTGPMACVAGAISELTGKRVISPRNQIFIENGGDIFARIDEDFNVGIYAGSNSPFSFSLGIKVKGGPKTWGIATSSGTVGHSFSMGDADAVTVLAESSALADGAATYLGNRIKNFIDKDMICGEIKNLPFIKGVLIIRGKEIFIWGDIELFSV